MNNTNPPLSVTERFEDAQVGDLVYPNGHTQEQVSVLTYRGLPVLIPPSFTTEELSDRYSEHVFERVTVELRHDSSTWSLILYKRVR